MWVGQRMCCGTGKSSIQNLCQGCVVITRSNISNNLVQPVALLNQGASFPGDNTAVGSLPCRMRYIYAFDLQGRNREFQSTPYLGADSIGILIQLDLFLESLTGVLLC